MFWMVIWETVICDMLIRALTPSSRATAAIVDELFFESFSFNALVGALRVWVTKSSHILAFNFCGLFELPAKLYGCQRLA